MTKKDLRFDELLARLEEVVARLESEKIDLETSLSLYEEGMRLVKSCNEKLDEAEQRIESIQINESGEVTTAPFEGQA